jgi:hypothetical protein
VKFYRHRRIRPMRVWMFGKHADPSRSPASRQAWLDAYRAHNAAVRAHFATRPGHFLEMNIIREPRWDELCAFLRVPVPDRPLPHANPTEPDSLWRPAWRRLRRALGVEQSLPDD